MKETREYPAERSAIQKGLFITFEGLPATIADSQVLIHIEEMAKHGIEFELWVFAVTTQKFQNARIKSRVLNNVNDTKIKVFRAVRPAIPFSEIINASILGFNLLFCKAGFDFFHARTDYAAAVCGLLKWSYRTCLIWDCRGETIAEFLLHYSPKGVIRKVLAAYKVGTLRIRRFLSAHTCDKAIFVSEKLYEFAGKGMDSKELMIIPSIASSDYFFFDPSLRKTKRNALGIARDEAVMIFSGSITEYQSFPEQIAFFEKIRRKDPRFKLIVLTPDIEKAETEMFRLPAESYLLKNVSFQEVNSCLNAADFGLFIKKRNKVNLPASPLKFAEYCLTGLRIIMTDAVEQSYRIAKELDNLCYYDFSELPTNLEPFDKLTRERIAEAAKEKLSRSSYVHNYMTLYNC